jgi:hypothetical protein
MGLFDSLKLGRLVISESEIIGLIRGITESEEGAKAEVKMGVVIALKGVLNLLSNRELVTASCQNECSEILEKWLKS